MIKQVIIGTIFLLGAVSFSVNAQLSSVSDVQVNEAQAPVLVNVGLNNITGNDSEKASLRALLGQFTTLKGSFKQTIVDMQGEELQSANGELLLQKPQKLKWTVLSPDESLLIADGTTVYNVDPFLEQVTLLDQAPLIQSNPLMLLVSDQQSQWDKVSVAQQENTFTLTSLRADSPVTKLILSFDTEKKLSTMVSYDRQQQQNRLDFSNVVLNENVSSQDFIFSADPDWVVDDQRDPATK
jgi:outer membrane lipoprotein carrier protein